MATNMYIRFEDPRFSASGKEIEILSWNHGFSQPDSPTRGTAQHSNLGFTKYLDGESNELMRFCWGGKQIEKGTLTCFRSDGARDNKPVKYLEVVMQHVVISNYAVSGGPGDIPVENVSLDYGTIEYKYIEQRHADEGRPPKSLMLNKAAGTIE